MAGFRTTSGKGAQEKPVTDQTATPTLNLPQELQDILAQIGHVMFPDPDKYAIFLRATQKREADLRRIARPLAQVYTAHMEEELALYRWSDQLALEADALVDVAAEAMRTAPPPQDSVKTTPLNEINLQEQTLYAHEALSSLVATEDFAHMSKKGRTKNPLSVIERGIPERTLEQRILLNLQLRRSTMAKVTSMIVDSDLLKQVTDVGAIMFYEGSLAGSHLFTLRSSVKEAISNMTNEPNGNGQKGPEIVINGLESEMRVRAEQYYNFGRTEQLDGEYTPASLPVARISLIPIVTGGHTIGVFQYVQKEGTNKLALEKLRGLLERLDSQYLQLETTSTQWVQQQHSPRFSPFKLNKFSEEFGPLQPEANASLIFGNEEYMTGPMRDFSSNVSAVLSRYFKAHEDDPTYGTFGKLCIEMAWNYFSVALQMPSILASFSEQMRPILGKNRRLNDQLTPEERQELVEFPRHDNTLVAYARVASEMLRGEVLSMAAAEQMQEFSPANFSHGAFIQGRYLEADIIAEMEFKPDEFNWDVEDMGELTKYLIPSERAVGEAPDEYRIALTIDAMLQFADDKSDPVRARNGQISLSERSILNRWVNTLEGAIFYVLRCKKEMARQIESTGIIDSDLVHRDACDTLRNNGYDQTGYSL